MARESTIDGDLRRPLFLPWRSNAPIRHPAAAGDTRVRRKVLAMTMALAAITYLDRVAIGVTRPYIARDLDLTPTQMGYVFSAFYLSYALFEIPTGWWGDKVGTRKVLTRIVCWWSAFTVLTGFAFSYSSLLADSVSVRRGRGRRVAECRAHVLALVPAARSRHGAGHVLHGRAPRRRADAAARHRAARVHGLADVVRRVRIDRVRLGARVVSMVSRYAGRASALSARPSARFIEDGIVTDERPLEKTQWKRLLANRTVICLCLMYFTQTFGNAFYVTWLPTYLASRGLSVTTAAILVGAAADAERRRRSDAAASRPTGRPGGWVSVSAGSSSEAARCRRRACSRLPRVHRFASRRRRADCARRRVFELPARSGMGDVPRHRRPPRGRVERGDEHIGAGRRDPQPDSHRRSSCSDLRIPGAPLYLTGILFLFGAVCWLWVDPTKPVSD